MWLRCVARDRLPNPDYRGGVWGRERVGHKAVPWQPGQPALNSRLKAEPERIFSLTTLSLCGREVEVLVGDPGARDGAVNISTPPPWGNIRICVFYSFIQQNFTKCFLPVGMRCFCFGVSVTLPFEVMIKIANKATVVL